MSNSGITTGSPSCSASSVLPPSVAVLAEPELPQAARAADPAPPAAPRTTARRLISPGGAVIGREPILAPCPVPVGPRRAPGDQHRRRAGHALFHPRWRVGDGGRPRRVVARRVARGP